MTPDEVVKALADIPDIRSAKVGGSKSKPQVLIKYVNDFSDLGGFEFNFDFDFENRRLYWVDLVGRSTCTSNLESDKAALVKQLTSRYGPEVRDGVFNKGRTDIYVLSAENSLPSVNSANAEIAYNAERLTAYVAEKCGGGWLGHITVRFRANEVSEPKPLTPDEVAKAQVAAKAARDAAERKTRSDKSRLDLN